MRVRINGKEVEVGPSKHVREKLDDSPNLTDVPYGEPKNDYPKFTVNGQEVDMNNPDNVQKAMRIFRITGGIVLLVSIICWLAIFNTENWTNFDEDIWGGIFVASVWFLLGVVFTFIVPKIFQKRLKELKRQGKVPSKYGNR